MIDPRFMAAALTLAQRGRVNSTPNPNVGCVLVKDGCVVGRGWTQKGGRPHAEAMALMQAGVAAKGTTAYVTLEPCAHDSERGPACCDILIAAGVAHVVIAMQDPDSRTNGAGIARLADAGITVDLGIMDDAVRASMAGWLMQRERRRPFVTLKLATALDGCIALTNGQSQWITGEAARAHTHAMRAQNNAILVGRGTMEADNPRLDVRLTGLEEKSPLRFVLTSGHAPDGWTALDRPEAVHTLKIPYLMVEGGAETAASFLKAGLVDQIMLYRAPILIGKGRSSLGDLGLTRLSDAHGQWRHIENRKLGVDTLDIFNRV